MNVTLQREKSTEQSTPGKVYVEAEYLCFSLEDVVRDVKIKGMTAIPAGRYKLDFTFSNRFQKSTLILLNVPGFEGIRIHGGNDSGDTEGCLLLGKVRVSADRIRDCAPAVLALEEKVLPLLGEDVWIDVVAAQEQTVGVGLLED